VGLRGFAFLVLDGNRELADLVESLFCPFELPGLVFPAMLPTEVHGQVEIEIVNREKHSGVCIRADDDPIAASVVAGRQPHQPSHTTQRLGKFCLFAQQKSLVPSKSNKTYARCQVTGYSASRSLNGSTAPIPAPLASTLRALWYCTH